METKDILVSEIANGPTFLWLEFLDPKDGIVFASEVTAPSELPRWSNITDQAPPKYSPKVEQFPQRQSVNVVSVKKTTDYTGYLCKEDGRLGSVMYAKRINRDEEPINMEIFSNPKLIPGKGGPNVYIISGHGAQGRVYGEGRTAGELYLSDLNPDKNLRLLILACCNNGARSRMAILSKYFSEKSLMAILGFSFTYPGGLKGKDIFKTFGRLMRSSPDRPIVEIWKEAAEKGDKSKTDKCEWAAAFAAGAEKMTPRSLMFPESLNIDRNRNARYFNLLDPIDGEELTMPYVKGFFIFSNSSVGDADLDEVVKQMRKPNLIKYLEDNYLKIDNISGRNFLYFETAGMQKYLEFKAGDVFLVRFFVVRTNWYPDVDLSQVFSFEKSQPFPRCEVDFPFGEKSDCIRISIKENCKNLKIAVLFQEPENSPQRVGKYLVGLATKDGEVNPWDLNMVVLKLSLKGGEVFLPNGEKFERDNVKRYSWASIDAQDLRIYPNRFEVTGVGTSRGQFVPQF